MKICFSCQTSKPETEFYKTKATKDGLQSQCRACQYIRRRDPEAFKTRKPASKVAEAVKTPEPPKKLPKVILATPEPIVSLPGIYEVQNRGKGYTSFRFESPLDGSIFSYESFAEARRGRQSMMDAFTQAAVFENVHRQSTGKKPFGEEDA